ncbi:MAG TPA: helix-turn-helix domain-containing protein [Candidatus Faecousia excrementipullorum]|nr:helix-turn-helix domain-containing protein [Candidatus Faecousia excrementipullorum]
MDAKITGCFIAQLRKELGLTQKELAEKLEVTDKAISRWETGKGLPDTSLLKPLAEILGVSVGELLSGKRMDDSQIKSQADHIILESLSYEERQEKWKGILRYVFLGILVALGGFFFALVLARFATSKDAAVSLGIGMYLCIVTITCTGIVLLRIKDKL